MQETKNDTLINSEIGKAEELFKKAQKDLKSGKADRITIANFSQGETVELRGLKFKISSINQKAQRLTLKMVKG